ncbi:hypothetical protein GFZ65_26315 [Escherichia coli]|nr:hypothetical protein [Escherichia coli]
MSIKNDGHYFCRAGGNRPDGLNEPVTYKAHLRVGLIMKPEFILGNQLRQYSETTQASKWGNNTGSH